MDTPVFSNFFNSPRLEIRLKKGIPFMKYKNLT